jgi:hypothetical protein
MGFLIRFLHGIAGPSTVPPPLRAAPLPSLPRGKIVRVSRGALYPCSRISSTELAQGALGFRLAPGRENMPAHPGSDHTGGGGDAAAAQEAWHRHVNPNAMKKPSRWGGLLRFGTLPSAERGARWLQKGTPSTVNRVPTEYIARTQVSQGQTAEQDRTWVIVNSPSFSRPLPQASGGAP